MRVYIAVFALCFIAAVMTSAPYPNADKEQRAESSHAEPHRSVAVNEKPDTSENEAGKSDSNSPKWYTALKRPEWLTLIVAVLALIVIGWQSCETRKAANAATLGVKISISKERFRIKVRPRDQWNFPVDFDPSAQQAVLRHEYWQGVMYDLHCYGLTEGYILEAFDGASVSDSPDAPPLSISRIHNLPWRIDPTNPQQSHWPGQARMLTRMETLQDAIDVVEGRKFIHFWGRIKYRDVFFDVFGTDRETSWRWVWKFTGNAGDTAIGTPLGGRFGKWDKCGPPEDNRET